MKIKGKKILAYEHVLNSHNIHRPVKINKTLLRLFSERTSSTVQVGEAIESVKLIIALKKQISIEKSQHPAGAKTSGGFG